LISDFSFSHPIKSKAIKAYNSVDIAVSQELFLSTL
jgi:hypothetical protein